MFALDSVFGLLVRFLQPATLRKIPGLLEVQRPSRKSQLAAKKFDLKYKSFEDWCTRNAGSLPRVNAETADERTLAHWLKNKLSSCRQGKLPDDQLAKLKKIPGLSDFPQVSQESRKHAAEFDDACKRLEDWSAAHHGMPLSNKKESLSPEEMSMAVWLKNKLAFHKRRGLPGDQRAKLGKKLWLSTQVDLAAGARKSRLSIKSSKNLKNPVAEALRSLNTSERVPSYSEQQDLRYKSFEAWCATHNGSLPRRKGDSFEERSLASWLKRKLYDYRCGKLSKEQLAKLKQIPYLTGFPNVSAKSQMLIQKFDCTFKSFKDWCAVRNGTLPKQSGATKEERWLAIWLNNKLCACRRGTLSNHQLDQFRMLPGLSDFPNVSARSQRFECTYESLKGWCAAHNGTLPKERGGTAEERSFGIWLRNKLHNHKCGKLPHQHLAKLKELFSVLGTTPNVISKD